MRACGCAGGHAPAPVGTLLVPRGCMRRWQLRRRARNAADQVDEPRTVYARDLVRFFAYDVHLLCAGNTGLLWM